MAEHRHLSRRAMLGTALGAAAAVGVSGAATGTAQAAQGTWWPGRRRVPKERVSIQLYTLRTLLEDDTAGTLEALADIGYRNVELAGTYGRSAEEFRGLLDRYHLRAASAHVGFDGADVDQLIADAKVLGYHYADCAYAKFDTITEWKAFAGRLDTAAGAFRKAGISYGYHNHNHEFERLEGTRPFDVLAWHTARRNVHFEFDLYWVIEAGADPVWEFYRQFGRVRQYHVKDRAPGGGWANLGEGTIDFGRIFRDTWYGNVRDYVVEHDAPSDPLRTAEVGYDYLRDLRF